MMNSNEVARLTSTLDWLEEESRNHKAGIARLHVQHEHLLTFVRDFLDGLRLVQDEVAMQRSHLAHITTLDDGLKATQARLNHHGESVVDLEKLIARNQQGGQVEVDRLRQTVADLWQRAESLRQDLDPLPLRISALSETQQRIVESLQETRQAQEQLRVDQSAILHRIGALADVDKRLEEQFADVRSELQALRDRDDGLSDQIRVTADRVVRVEETANNLLSEEERRRSVEEQVHLQRVSATRTEQRLSEVATTVNEHTDLIEGIQRFSKQVDDRRSSLADRVDSVNEELERVRLELAELIADFGQMEEHHRSRLITELQQQVRDVRARIAKARRE